MKKVSLVFLSAMLFVSAFFAGSVSSATAQELKILEFDTMVGVPRPYTGSANAIRGLAGGGLPWVVGSAHGELTVNGHLEVAVQGLLIDPNDPAAIAAGRAGTNPSPTFKAIVSCLSKDGAGNPTTVNVSTTTFPADAGGNSTIEAQVALPKPCIAPIIFVTSAGNAWFAATGY
jgi:hypothetical protein